MLEFAPAAARARTISAWRGCTDGAHEAVCHDASVSHAFAVTSFAAEIRGEAPVGEINLRNISRTYSSSCGSLTSRPTQQYILGAIISERNRADVVVIRIPSTPAST